MIRNLVEFYLVWYKIYIYNYFWKKIRIGLYLLVIVISNVIIRNNYVLKFLFIDKYLMVKNYWIFVSFWVKMNKVIKNCIVRKLL